MPNLKDLRYWGLENDCIASRGIPLSSIPLSPIAISYNWVLPHVWNIVKIVSENIFSELNQFNKNSYALVRFLVLLYDFPMCKRSDSILGSKWSRNQKI